MQLQRRRASASGRSNQIVNDTQYYVRDAVIDYVTAKGTVSPAIEGRLAFITDTDGPVITITTPAAKSYCHSDQSQARLQRDRHARPACCP